ncbi:MAG: hypothetical protein EA402_12650 [Planctomycetota bacterium]|nr:MAG: hypothetical protein EA402_12650 [Planctomycetota bacterium]
MRSLYLWLSTACLFATYCLSLGALETPLTLTQPGGEGNRLVTIDENSGALRLYELQQGTGAQALRQIAPWNFLIDLDRIRNIRLIIDNPNRVDRRNDPEFVFWPLARTGSGTSERGRPSNIPAYGDMYSYFLPNQRAVVLRTEDQFFDQLPSYDGVVRAGLSRDFLFLAIPSSYTILVYRIAEDSFDLVSYRNYRPELYLTIPDQAPRGLPTFGSTPRFNDMIRALQQIRGGDLLLAERAQQVEEAVAALESEDEVFAIAPSDPWVQGLMRNRFLMLDPPNNRILIYEFLQNDSMTLRSMRNFDLDRRIPSWPLPRRDLQEFDRAVVESYMGRLMRMRQAGQIEGIVREVMEWYAGAKRSNELEFVTANAADVQVILFRKLAEQQSLLVGAETGGTARRSESPYDAVVDSSERLILDLKRDRRLLVYLLRGAGDLIELRTSRDYTIETGIAVYDYEISKRQAAARVFTQIESMANRRGARVEELVMRNIQYLLTISPEMYEQLEANRRIVRQFATHELWQPTIEKAMADTQARQERLQSLVGMIKQELISRDGAIRAARERAANRPRR